MAAQAQSTNPANSAVKPLVHPQTRDARRLAGILAGAGIELNGSRPWDLQVHDPRLFHRVLSHGSLGAGESYVDGWWDAGALDDFFTRVNRIDPWSALRSPYDLWLLLKGTLLNLQRRALSSHVARQHYDLGNDLYEAMLDPTMQYTCAYWARASSLEEAQIHKLRLICEKLRLQPGMSVLELGGGFGGLARFIAREYGCSVVSYNISRQQTEYARNLCAGLPVRFELADYRDAAREPALFHRVVSIGLCEHIGHKNYRGFLELAASRLHPEGLFLLHTIGSNQSVTYTDPWIDKYIFPHGMIPSIAQLGRAMEGLWVVEDWHNFGPDYDKTLLAWWRNFDRRWPALEPRYGPRFYRTWKYYLLACAGRFRARQLQLWQVVLSKGDVASYSPVR